MGSLEYRTKQEGSLETTRTQLPETKLRLIIQLVLSELLDDVERWIL